MPSMKKILRLARVVRRHQAIRWCQCHHRRGRWCRPCLEPRPVCRAAWPQRLWKVYLDAQAGSLLGPNSGSVTICGQRPYELSSEARAAFRARHVGFVFQRFHLIPYLRVLENLLTPTLALGIDHAEQRAAELLEQFGLSQRKNHRPEALSVGKQQRVALARALLPKPELVLADEPTGNLDEANSTAVLDVLASYAASGHTVLMVNHDPQARDRANRRIAMAAGKLTPE